MDIDTIPPGVDFTDYVRRAVGSCDVLLAFIGDRWTTLTDEHGTRRLDDPTDWVVEEIRVALGRGVRVIPVLVEGAAMPAPRELPESLRTLVNRQALLLRHDTFSADFARLVAGIEHAGAELRAARQAVATAPTSAVSEAPPGQYADRWESAAPVGARPEVPRRIPASGVRRRWLVTVPIVLAAAVVGVLVVVLHPFRPTLSDPPATGVPSATLSPVASRPPAEPAPVRLSQLRTRIPQSFRTTCTKLEPGAAALRVSLAVAAQCAPAQVISRGAPAYSFYFQYATPEPAATAFRAYYNPGRFPTVTAPADPPSCHYDASDGG